MDEKENTQTYNFKNKKAKRFAEKKSKNPKKRRLLRLHQLSKTSLLKTFTKALS